MTTQMYSVDEVAELLGLHVKTVRSYVRDGRLSAVRIGKQYRIARPDLEAFTGQAGLAAEATGRTRHAEVSSIVQIDGSSEAVSRLSQTILALLQGRAGERAPLRVETVLDVDRGSLK